MSYQIKFDFYDKDGNVVASQVEGLCFLTHGENVINLNEIHKSFFSSWEHPMNVRRDNWCYASPSHIKDYMFDLKDKSLLPNRFLK